MKKIVILTAMALIVTCSLSFAGEIRQTPKYIVLTEPTTNIVELLSMEFFYAANPYAVIHFNVLDSNGDIRAEHAVRVRNRLDDPETDASLCVGVGDPWPCCTGAGTGDCDESTTDFTDFVNGYGETMKSRGDVEVWQYILNRYDTQETP